MLLPVSKTGYQFIQDMICTLFVKSIQLPPSTLNTPNIGIFLIFQFFLQLSLKNFGTNYHKLY